jgi:hypothetical protein
MFTRNSISRAAGTLAIAIPMGVAPLSVADDTLPEGLSRMDVGNPGLSYVYTRLGNEFDIMYFVEGFEEGTEGTDEWYASMYVGDDLGPAMTTSGHQIMTTDNESGLDIHFAVSRNAMIWADNNPLAYENEAYVEQYVDYSTQQATTVKIRFDRMTLGIWSERAPMVVVMDQNGPIEASFVSIPVASQWEFKLPAGSNGRIWVSQLYSFEGVLQPGEQLETSDGEELRIRVNFSNPADINGDDLVDGEDLTSLLALWGKPCQGCAEDISNDGIVSGPDLTLLLAGWRTGLD